MSNELVEDVFSVVRSIRKMMDEAKEKAVSLNRAVFLNVEFDFCTYGELTFVMSPDPTKDDMSAVFSVLSDSLNSDGIVPEILGYSIVEGL